MKAFSRKSNNLTTFESIDEVQSWILASILESGHSAHPRNLNTLELSPVAFGLLHPRRRCITNPQRRWSLPLALGELCWHLSGSNELGPIEYYAKRWRDFADTNSTIRGSCYGHRIFGPIADRPSQWQRLLNLLQTDPQTRRAVLDLSDSSLSLDPQARDVACASTIQFLIRFNRLDAIVCMRSNDAIWGLPYDVFLFSMLQELLACELRIELGCYFHFAGSMHLYEKHFELARGVIDHSQTQMFEMPTMQGHGQVEVFLKCEGVLRSGLPVPLQQMELLHDYWGELVSVLDWFRLARLTGGYKEVADRIPTDSPYSLFLQNLVGAPEAKSRAQTARAAT